MMTLDGICTNTTTHPQSQVSRKSLTRSCHVFAESSFDVYSGASAGNGILFISLVVLFYRFEKLVHELGLVHCGPLGSLYQIAPVSAQRQFLIGKEIVERLLLRRTKR